LLRTQLRAMLKAGAKRELRIMFPMVATCAEFDAAKILVEREIAHLARHGYELPADLKLGIMIEVPSVLWSLDEILPRVDFVSVGSNDLVQYLFAADRDNRRVADRFDPLAPAVLRALRMVAEKGAAHGTHVTLCGEIGGRPLEAMALIGIGYRGLSMSPASIGPVKAMLLSLDAGEISAFVRDLLAQKTGVSSLRQELRAFAEAKGVPL
jgi:phosphotransferase system enzyme I (PtsP)